MQTETHNWVARNIRYVGIGFEDGGWTSQPADAVLASRYGDCKAHATLLKALLAAQGIEANLVAVNAGAQYTLTEVATPNFDHAIVYVPEIDQYLDPTVSLLAFGSLPPNVAGKPALNVDRGMVVNIPVATPERFAMAADTIYTLASDGTREARSTLSGTGLGALIGRSLAQELEKVERSEVAKRLIERAGLAGTGDYSFTNPRGFNFRQLCDHGHVQDQQACRSGRTGAGEDAASDRPARLAFAAEHRWCKQAAIPLPLAGIPRDQFTDDAGGDLRLRKAGAGGRLTRRTSAVRRHSGAGPRLVDVRAVAEGEGRTVRSNASVRLALDAPVCPAEFAAVIRSGLDEFTELKYGPIGLTPKSAAASVTKLAPILLKA